MRLVQVLLVSLMFQAFSYSQEMLASDNVWIYTYQDLNTFPPTEITYRPLYVTIENETEINSILYKKLNFTFEAPCGLHGESEYFREFESKVYFYDQVTQTDLLIYDFNETESYYMQYKKGSNEIDDALIKIDSVKMIAYSNDIQLQTQFAQICYHDNNGNYDSCYPTEIIRNIGANYFLFQDIESLCDPEDFIIGKRCFYSNEFELNFTTLPCDTLYTEIISSNEEFQNESFNIFPNPTSGILKLSTNAKIEFISLINSDGQELKTFESDDEINISEFPTGVYFLMITFDKDKRSIKRIIKAP